MSEFAKPSQSDFIQECKRLHDAQLAAQTAEDRDAADAEMGHFIRMNAAGRLQEYFANRQAVPE